MCRHTSTISWGLRLLERDQDSQYEIALMMQKVAKPTALTAGCILHGCYLKRDRQECSEVVNVAASEIIWNNRSLRFRPSDDRPEFSSVVNASEQK